MDKGTDAALESTSRSQALAIATSELRTAGVESPRLDAELLLGHVLGVDRLALFHSPEAIVPPIALSQFRILVVRRCRREPLPYLTGFRSFLDVELSVGPGVLIPRPETELLVEVASGRLLPSTAPFVIDVGAGSGAVAIGIARLRRDARIIGTELSPKALEIALRNVEVLGMAGQVTLLPGDLFGPALGEWRGRVDLVVSNPPYIPGKEIDGLQPEVAMYEPRMALDGGPDGLEIIRRLILEAGEWLKPGGSLAFEIGAGQAPAVQALLEEAGYQEVKVNSDLAGIPRVVSSTFGTAESSGTGVGGEAR